MKLKYKYLLLPFIALLAGAMVSGCSDDDKGAPFISYIRVTRPAASDSLLATAGQGQMIAIMGGNLQSASQVWFNDRKAKLLPTFITSGTIITSVPSEIPGNVTNKLKMIFSNGDSLLYDFRIDINKPRIDYTPNEYVADGDLMSVYGDYFYEPLKVTFTGGLQAEISSISTDSKTVIVKVPAGAQPGPVTFTSNFGETISDFWFRDNRNIIASFDIPLASGMWHVHDVVATDPAIPNINGKFLRVNKGALAAYPFLEVYEGTQTSDLIVETKKIPQAAFIAPGNYSLKFEINTLASITGANMRLYLGNDAASGGDFGAGRSNYYYVWQPNLNTEGKWQTVTIPWANVFNDNNKNASDPNKPASPPFIYNSAGYGMGIYFHGPNPAIYNLAIDNIRVVPNEIE